VCRGRSRAEFVAKLGTVEEEADESAFLMEMIIEGELLKQEHVQPLLNEANEIVKIMARSRISASNRIRPTANGKQSSRNSNRQSAIGNRQ
jgi:four helix bundle protein